MESEKSQARQARGDYVIGAIFVLLMMSAGFFLGHQVGYAEGKIQTGQAGSLPCINKGE